MDWTEQLIDQLEWHWTNHLWPRWEGITDDEYLWEPAADAWSLRPRSEATSAMAAGAGEIVIDWAYPEPTPPPVTTIAWRMAHIAVDVFGTRAANHFGAEPIDHRTTEWTLSAADGLDRIEGSYRSWLEGVRSLGPDDLSQPCGPAEGPFADYPMAALILHINREAIHHGAEICLLRDLYARTK